MKTFRFIPLSTRRVPSRRQVAKAVRRWWLQVTAPKWAREVWLKNRKKKSVRVCDMNDGHGSEITVSPRVPGEELPPVAEAPAKNIVSIVDYDGRHVLGPDEYEIVSVDESAWD